MTHLTPLFLTLKSSGLFVFNCTVHLCKCEIYTACDWYITSAKRTAPTCTQVSNKEIVNVSAYEHCRYPKSNLNDVGIFFNSSYAIRLFPRLFGLTAASITTSHHVSPSLIFLLQLLLALRPKQLATQQPSKNIYSLFYIIKSDRKKIQLHFHW